MPSSAPVLLLPPPSEPLALLAARTIAASMASGDPTAILQGALITPKARHYAAILEPEKLGQLLRAIDDFECYPVTKLALKIAPHIFVRPGDRPMPRCRSR